MKIPNSIRIGGVDYSIEHQENVRLGNVICYGTIDYTTSTILISTTDSVGHQHKCITLWHEIMHGIFEHACSHPENEEEIVDILSKGIYQVLQDNGMALFDIARESKETVEEIQ